MLPAIVGQLVVVLKDSALGFAITYVELLSQGQTLGTARANMIPSLIITAVIFITINYLLTVFAGRIEGRLRPGWSHLRHHAGGPRRGAGGRDTRRGVEDRTALRATTVRVDETQRATTHNGQQQRAYLARGKPFVVTPSVYPKARFDDQSEITR
jgi:hypothetical protein